MNTEQDIFELALKLPKEARLRLISQLAESCVKDQDPGVREETICLIEERQAAYEAGQRASLDPEETLKRLRGKLDAWTRSASSS